jgi:hypothetical protein
MIKVIGMLVKSEYPDSGKRIEVKNCSGLVLDSDDIFGYLQSMLTKTNGTYINAVFVSIKKYGKTLNYIASVENNEFVWGVTNQKLDDVLRKWCGEL